MSKITLIESQKKNPKRFNVYIDGNFGFGADEDLVMGYRLMVGKEVKEEALERLLFEAEVGKLLERLYGLISIRVRSEKEVKDYLKNLSFKRRSKSKEEISDLEIGLAIEKLKQKGLINDLEFAKTWVESRRRSKKKGLIALKSELIKKGIDREIIDQVLSGQIDEDEEILANQALEKKINSFKNLDPTKLRQKATDYLLRKGFTYQVIRRVLQKVVH